MLLGPAGSLRLAVYSEKRFIMALQDAIYIDLRRAARLFWLAGQTDDSRTMRSF